MLRLISTLSVIMLIIMTGGCGKSYKLVPAEGIVLIGGKPAKNINVQFLPDALRGGNGPTSFAITDEEGKFILKTYDGQLGAVLGPHMIVLADMDEERTPQGKVAKKLPRLDSKFSIAGKGLSFVVSGSGDPIILDVAVNTN